MTQWTSKAQKKYLSETVEENIVVFLKLIQTIYYSDNLRTCLVHIMGH